MIKSMTGFARQSIQNSLGAVTCEIKSVNHRFLDCNFRLPETMRKLEPQLRELIASKIERGRIDCFIKYQTGENAKLELILNTNLIKQIAKATQEINKYFNSKNPTINPMQVLSWNNVLQINEQESDALDKKVIKLFTQTISELVKSKENEGKALKKTIEQRLQIIRDETTKVKKIFPCSIETQREKLTNHLSSIKTELNIERIEQEMLFFIQKIDIDEELDRLTAHCGEIAQTLKEPHAVGKRLDFLMQELNREANTIASKSTNKQITHAAIEMKVTIEQMREQVQNIE